MGSMNTALQIISIQHELVLSLGTAPNLKAMLQQFLRVCNARLNFNSSHIFLYHDQDNTPCSRDASVSVEKIFHFISLPMQQKGQSWSTNKELLNKVIDFDQQNIEHLITKNEHSDFYFFQISNYGVMVIECHKSTDGTLIHTLEPILDRLAISCSAAIDHETLIREIEARKAAEEQIVFQATHDDLTGLFNRRELTNQLDNIIQSCDIDGHCGALVFIDLNDFKSINDLLGHNIGDQVLRQVADRLTKIVPEKYPIARFGGNEFIILLNELSIGTADEEIHGIIKRISDEIEKPFSIDGNNYSISCSAGYDLFCDRNTLAIDHIKNADLAMYEAKHAGASNGVGYNKAMSEKLNQKLRYNAELKRALEKHEFELHYQPQFDNEKNIIGAEALLRWNNPLRGYESPAIYIPIAEESDLIIHISEWVLDRACQDIKLLEQLKLPDSFKKLSINISAKHLAEDNFVDCIMSAINKHKISKHHLAIEITESIMMGDIKRSIEMLEELRDKEVECSIDDFGTGYSSLTYLKQLPASLIKIDRAFVKDIHKDKDNYSIAGMIIGLGRGLDMEVIAEGVENQEELDCLNTLGCNQYQGFFFCKPIPITDMIELIEQQGRSQTAL